MVWNFGHMGHNVLYNLKIFLINAVMEKCSWPKTKGKKININFFFPVSLNAIYMFAHVYMYKHIHSYLLWKKVERKLEELYKNNSSLWEVILFIYIFSVFVYLSFDVFSKLVQSSYVFCHKEILKQRGISEFPNL